MTNSSHISIPLRHIGPLKLIGDVNDEIMVPLATYETPLWPTTNRGAKVSRQCGGIQTTLIDNCMSRSICLEGPSARYCHSVAQQIEQQTEALQQVIEASSRFAKLDNIHCRIVGNLLYVRLRITSGDASGHNMVTLAAEQLLTWLCEQFQGLRYVSISGNICVDKKVSAINSLRGRGKHIIAEILIPEDICQSTLKTSAVAIHALNLKKNHLGSIIAGSLCSANAHFANILSAFYLATGQDVANVVEGSQGIVTTDLRDEGLYFAISLPNIIVGSVGSGKTHGFVCEHMQQLGCEHADSPGAAANRLASICAATVLCGELSLLAAQTNPGELMRTHKAFERGSAQYQEHVCEASPE